MSTVSQIITKAFREAGIVEVGGSPEAAEQTEALDLLQDIYLSLFGNELGEQLTSIKVGDYTDCTNYLVLLGFIPLNARLLMNLTTAKSLYLHPNPDDGARFAIVDNSDNFSTYNLIIDANGRTIEGNDTLTVNTDGLVREWFYRADLGEWVRVTDLATDSESPLPREFDSLLSGALAIRLNPRYGAQTSQEMSDFLARAKRQFRARYRQVKEVSSEDALLNLTTDTFYNFIDSGGYAIIKNRGTVSAAVTGSTGPLKTIISIGTDTTTAPSNTLTKYWPMCGGGTINAMWNSSTSRPDTPIAVQGTISNLYVRMQNALAAGQTWAWTLVRNGVDTNLTVTIDSTGLVQFDNTHTVSVTPGDTLCFKSVPTNTPTAQTVVQIACLFTATTGQTGPLFTVWAGAAVATGYGVPGKLNSGVQTELSSRGYMPTGGTITKMFISTNTAPGGTDTRTVTLMKNGADVMSCSITGTNTTATATGSVTYLAGDLLQLRRDNSATSASGLVACGLDWNPTNPGETIFLSPGTGNIDSTTTIFQNLNSTAETSETNEANTYNPIPVPCTITKWRVDTSAAPGAGKSRTCTIRKNGADTSAVITLQNSTTTQTISPGISLTAGDLVDWKEIPAGSPAASNPMCTAAVITVT